MRDLAACQVFFTPQFGCENCGEAMHPEYYKGIRGHEYKFTDVRQT
ncbi:hypothetical protein J2X61_001480 [Bacillus sp. 3255]|nr:hypothetical protein [Bacillus sp. 3255]